MAWDVLHFSHEHVTFIGELHGASMESGPHISSLWFTFVCLRPKICVLD